MKIFGYEIRKYQKPTAPISTYGVGYGILNFNTRLTANELLKNATVNSCCGIISDAIAALPLDLYKKLENGSREKAENEPLERLVKHQPNFYQMPYTFKKMIVMNLLLNGNAYIFTERGANGNITALYPLNPEQMTIKKFSDRDEFYYIYQSNEGQYKYTADSILHIPATVLNGVYGLSPIALASNAADMGLQLENAALNSITGGIHSKLVVNVPITEKKFTRADREQLEQRIVSEYSGLENQNKPLITTQGLTVQPLNINNPEQNQLIENRIFSVKEISKIFRVPLSMLGEQETHSNTEQQGRNFLNNTLRPWITLIEQYFNKLLPTYNRENYYFAFNYASLLESDNENRYSTYIKLVQAGLLTINQVMAKENWPLLESDIGDIRFGPANLMPLTKENISCYMSEQKAKLAELNNNQSD